MLKNNLFSIFSTDVNLQIQTVHDLEICKYNFCSFMFVLQGFTNTNFARFYTLVFHFAGLTRL